MVKIYSDASLTNKNTAGIACLVMDEVKNKIIESFFKKVPAKTISVAEAKAILEATKIAEKYRDDEVIIYNDNAPLINMIIGATPAHTTVSDLVDEIRKSCSVKYDCIEGINNPADALSVFAARRIM